MDGERLLPLIADYRSAVLSWVGPDGYPASARCHARWSPEQPERIELDSVPPLAVGVTGLACLLFHQHDEHLEGLRQLVVKGALTADGAFIASGVVTANGRPDTDQMPHAGAPLHMLAFLRLGRSTSKAYLRKRGAPWPPIPYDEIGRLVAEHNSRRS
jgi:hypothetical protein